MASHPNTLIGAARMTPTIFAASDTDRTLREGTYPGYYSDVVSEATRRAELDDVSIQVGGPSWGNWRTTVRIRTMTPRECAEEFGTDERDEEAAQQDADARAGE